jgi:FixJ family two-component response regulator/predicted regulator of Ras-like GTPase activity (Roadblock/LC7/MglB family)
MDAILVVDSDKKNLSAIQAGFGKLKQFKLLTASNAKSAVDILNKTEVSLLVSGMKLFGFSGIELIAYMTRMFPTTPCIAMLDPGQPKPYFSGSLKNSQALQFIEKPFEFKVLASMISKGVQLKNKGATKDGISLKNFLPIITSNERTCQIDIKTKRKKKGCMYFVQGGLIDASWEKKSGEPAISEMLAWQNVKISVSPLPVYKKDAKIEFGLMEKIGVKWDKQAETMECLPDPPDDPLPDAAVIDKLEQSLKKNVNILKTVKGYKGIAILTPNGKMIASEVADNNIDFSSFSADFTTVLNQGNQAAHKHDFENCSAFTMHTPKGIMLMMTADDYAHGSYRFITLMEPDGNGFFMQVQLEKTIPKILNI